MLKHGRRRLAFLHMMSQIDRRATPGRYFLPEWAAPTVSRAGQWALLLWKLPGR